MPNKLTISLLPGDGIGQEISKEAIKILKWVSNNTDYKLDITEELIGGASIDKFGSPLTDETLKE